MPPDVSVIVPCYNERKTIRLLLEALDKQTFPHHQMEVVIADGFSTDGTRQEISAFQEEHPGLSIKVVDNPPKVIPAGLNRAIAAAKGSIIVRLDAHSVPYPDYIACCVSALEQGLGENVGGVWEIRPGDAGWQGRAIAAAAANPLAVGDAFYRFSEKARAVDTVPFGAFRRSLVEKIGLFDENLETNEDYEFNVRLRLSGGIVWLDPSIRSVYFARPNLRELGRQYWRYGYWKMRMLRQHPDTIRWRQVLPPAFISSLLFCLVLWPVFPLLGWIFMIQLLSYFFALLGIGFYLALAKRDLSLIIGVPLAIATMHLSWGSAFLWSALVSR